MPSDPAAQNAWVPRPHLMTDTETETTDDAAIRIIDSVQDAEQSALEAVRTFLDEVNGVFPDLTEDGPRRKIIDSAFNMTQQLSLGNR